VEAVLGQDQPEVVRERRLGEHQRDPTTCEGGGEGVRVVEGDHHGVGLGADRETAFTGAERAVGCELDERLVEVSVVLAVEKEHLVTAGDHSCHPDRLRVGL
jgi:hypothetical protein